MLRWAALLCLLCAAACTAPAPIVAPAACTQPVAVVSRSYLVFFAPHSAELSPRARQVLGELANAYRRVGINVILARGNVDMAEIGLRDEGLGGRRAEAAADYLAALGVPADAVYTKDFGVSRLLVPTPAGVAEAQNRNVGFVPIGASAPGPQDCIDFIDQQFCDKAPTPDGMTACKQALFRAVRPPG